MTTRLGAVVTVVVALAGCSALPTFMRPAGALLERADGLVIAGRYTEAVAAYDEWLARYPDDGGAPRVASRRETVAALVETRAEVARLRRQLGERDADVGRLRQEAERLRQEGERLRTDLENLKRIDLRQERGR